MLQAIIDKDTSEIIIRGEFFELDKIYFLIERLSGMYIAFQKGTQTAPHGGIVPPQAGI